MCSIYFRAFSVDENHVTPVGFFATSCLTASSHFWLLTSGNFVMSKVLFFAGKKVEHSTIPFFISFMTVKGSCSFLSKLNFNSARLLSSSSNSVRIPNKIVSDIFLTLSPALPCWHLSLFFCGSRIGGHYVYYTIFYLKYQPKRKRGVLYNSH